MVVVLGRIYKGDNENRLFNGREDLLLVQRQLCNKANSVGLSERRNTVKSHEALRGESMPQLPVKCTRSIDIVSIELGDSKNCLENRWLFLRLQIIAMAAASGLTTVASQNPI